MKGARAENLVGRCAEVAGHAPNIKSYVLIYELKDGTIAYHRDGSGSSQLGMLELMKTGVINGMLSTENPD